MKKRIISFLSLCSVFFIGKPFANNTTDGQDRNKPGWLEATPGEEKSPEQIDMSFAGQRVPMENANVRRRFFMQLRHNQPNWAATPALVSKSKLYFPLIRPILKKYGIPDDFKFIPLIESGFTDEVSYSGAAGPWQMMPVTARRYGLEVNTQIDERYNVVKSTEAACKMIKELHKHLADWTLVAAAFNKGLSGVRGAMNNQKKHSYYALHLNGQAQQYVFRILAAKKTMEHATKTVLGKKAAHYHYSVPTFKVKVNNSIANLAVFAKKHGVSLGTLKAYNPWIKANRFDNPRKRNYVIEVPRLNEVTLAMVRAR